MICEDNLLHTLNKYEITKDKNVIHSFQTYQGQVGHHVQCTEGMNMPPCIHYSIDVVGPGIVVLQHQEISAA
jgi:hypothetical protein